MERSTFATGERIHVALGELAGTARGRGLTPKGRGPARGLRFSHPGPAAKSCAAASERGTALEGVSR
jgi:diaminobutyrate-2-oxoglutarate transaminase